jgi:hypothetical protein
MSTQMGKRAHCHKTCVSIELQAHTQSTRPCMCEREPIKTHACTLRHLDTNIGTQKYKIIDRLADRQTDKHLGRHRDMTPTYRRPSEPHTRKLALTKTEDTQTHMPAYNYRQTQREKHAEWHTHTARGVGAGAPFGYNTTMLAMLIRSMFGSCRGDQAMKGTVTGKFRS